MDEDRGAPAVEDPSLRAKGRVVGGQEGLSIGVFAAQAGGDVLVSPDGVALLVLTPFLPHEARTIPLFTAFPPKANF